jgi:hypothetical protein
MLSMLLQSTVLESCIMRNLLTMFSQFTIIVRSCMLMFTQKLKDKYSRRKQPSDIYYTVMQLILNYILFYILDIICYILYIILHIIFNILFIYCIIYIIYYTIYYSTDFVIHIIYMISK